MTDAERQARYDALTDAERDSFHVKLDEYADTLLNPNQGPYDNAHWHKVPPSPIIGQPEAAPVAASAQPSSAPPVPAEKRTSFWGWGRR